MRCVALIVATNPIAKTDPDQDGYLPEHRKKDARLLGAERHPDSDFVPPPGHVIRHDAIQAEHRKEKREATEESSQCGQQALTS